MRKVWMLTSLELCAFFGINRYRHTRDPKEKRRFRLMAGVVAFLLAMLFFYVGALVFGLCAIGLTAAVPAYLAMLASLLVLVFGLFKAGERIFGDKGYDLLAALPVRRGALVAARFLSLYIEDLIFTFLILLPGISVFCVLTRPAAWFYPAALLGALLLPILPLALSVLLGTLIAAPAARAKHKNGTKTLLTVSFAVAAILGSFALSFGAETLTPEHLTELATTIRGLIGRIYPPAVWFGDALTGTAPLGLLWLGLCSIGAGTVCVFVAGALFTRILQGLHNISAKHSYTHKSLDGRGLLPALYVRELKRYFSSAIYVSNTILGPILALVLAVALFITGPELITSALPLPIDVTALTPFLFSAILCMMTTTSTSLSMEGKQFPLIKSMPIPAKALFDAKILLNLSLALPFYLLSEVFLILALRPATLELAWLILLPAALLLFSVVLGITINLALPRFDWEREEQIVKQSASAALGGFAGTLLSLVLLVGAACLPAARHYVNTGVLLLLLCGTALLYRHNNKARLDTL